MELFNNNLLDKKASFNGEMRPLIVSEIEEVNGPGQALEIDATLADVYLVRSDTPEHRIGRPIICNVVDKWSGKIVALEVRYENSIFKSQNKVGGNDFGFFR